MAAIGYLNMKLWSNWWIMDDLRPVGPVGEKGRSSVGKVREWYMES
jgi:hypothetical protein